MNLSFKGFHMTFRQPQVSFIKIRRHREFPPQAHTRVYIAAVYRYMCNPESLR